MAPPPATVGLPRGRPAPGPGRYGDSMGPRVAKGAIRDAPYDFADTAPEVDPNAPVEDDKPSSFIESVKRGSGGVIASLGQTGLDLGLPTGGAIKYGERLEAENPADVTDIKDIASHPLQFGKETAGELTPQFGLGFGAARVGNVLGALAGIEGGPVTMAGGALVGGKIAQFLANLGQEYGGIRRDALEGGVDDKGKALVYGAGAAALDTFSPVDLVAARLAGKGLEKGAGLGLKGFWKPVGLATAGEGLTEPTQSFLERKGAGKPTTGPEAMADYGMSAAKGALGGAGVGTFEQVVGKDKTQNIPEPEPADPEKAAEGDLLYAPTMKVDKLPTPPTGRYMPEMGVSSIPRPERNRGPPEVIYGKDETPRALTDQRTPVTTAWQNAIGSIESGNDYTKRGPVIGKGRYAGQQAMGRYQIMPGNLPEWGRAALGRDVSVREFMSDPDIQDRIFNHRFGLLAKQHGTADDAASAWLTGRSLADAGGASDQLGTNAKKYVDLFNKYGGNGAGDPIYGPANQGGAPQDGEEEVAEGMEPGPPGSFASEEELLAYLNEGDTDATTNSILAKEVPKGGEEAAAVVKQQQTELDKDVESLAARADTMLPDEVDAAEQRLARRQNSISAAVEAAARLAKDRGPELYTDTPPLRPDRLPTDPKPQDPELAALGNQLAEEGAVAGANERSAQAQMQAAQAAAARPAAEVAAEQVERGKWLARAITESKDGGDPRQDFVDTLQAMGMSPELSPSEQRTLAAEETFRRRAAVREAAAQQEALPEQDTTLGVESAEEVAARRAAKAAEVEATKASKAEKETPATPAPAPAPEPTPEDAIQTRAADRMAARGPVVSKWYNEGVKAGLGREHNADVPKKQKANFEAGRKFAEDAVREAEGVTTPPKQRSKSEAIAEGVRAAGERRKARKQADAQKRIDDAKAAEDARKANAREADARKKAEAKAADDARKTAEKEAAARAKAADAQEKADAKKAAETKAANEQKAKERAEKEAAEKAAAAKAKAAKREADQKADEEKKAAQEKARKAAAAEAATKKAAPAEPKVDAEAKLAEDLAAFERKTEKAVDELVLSVFQRQNLDVFAKAVGNMDTAEKAFAAEAAIFKRNGQDPDTGKGEKIADLMRRLAASVEQTTENVVPPAKPAPETTVAEAPPVTATAVQLGALLNTAEKVVLAKAYRHNSFTSKTLARFTQDFTNFVNGVTTGISKGVQAVAKRVQAGALALMVVFNPTGLQQANNVFTPQTTVERTIEVRTQVPADAAASMSDLAIGVYETQAAAAMAQGKGFMIADKPNGALHVFDKDGKLIDSSAALYGAQAGDAFTPERLANKDVDSYKLADKITPAGTFRMHAVNVPYAGGRAFWLIDTKTDYWAVAVHSLWQEPGENRPGRIKSATVADNKISFGCINAAQTPFIKKVLANEADFEDGLVFVLPDNTALTPDLFPAETKTVTETTPAKRPTEKTPDQGLPTGDTRRPLQARKRGGRRFSLQGGQALNPRALADMQAMDKRLRAALDARGLTGVKLDSTTLADLIEATGEQDAQGYFDTVKGIGHLITVAVDSADPMKVLNHESVHALRAMGVIKRGDWSKLVKLAYSDPARAQFIKDTYPNLSKRDQHEEAVAEMFADWAENPTVVSKTPAAKGVVGRIKAFLGAIKNWALGSNYKTGEQALAAMLDGSMVAVKARGEQVGGGRTMFAGKNAKTALLDDLDTALNYSDGELARQKFGWHVDEASGQPMFEIDDSRMAFKTEFAKIPEGQDMRLGDVVDHPELFAAYPQLADVTFTKKASFPRNLGSYNERTNRLTLDTNLDPKTDRREDPRKIMAHELQHAVQAIEGWPRGGSVETRKLTNYNSLEKVRAHYDRRVAEAQEVANDDPTAGSAALVRELKTRNLVKALQTDGSPIRTAAEVVDTASEAVWDANRKLTTLMDKQDADYEKAKADLKTKELAAKAEYDRLNAEIKGLISAGNYEEAVPLGRERDKAYREMIQAITASPIDIGAQFRARDVVRDEIAEAEKTLKAARAELNKLGNFGDIEFQMYELLTGEAQARDTEARTNRTADERRIVKPGTDEALPANEQINIYTPGSAGRTPSTTAKYRRGPVGAAAARTPQAYATRTAVQKSARAIDVSGRELLKKLHLWLAGTEDVANMMSKLIPSARKLVDLVSRGHAKARKFEERIALTKDAYHKLEAKWRGTGKGSISEFLYDSVSRAAWGYQPAHKKADGSLDPTMAKAKIDPDLKARFDKMPPAVQKVIKDVFEYNHDSREELYTAITKSVDAEHNPKIAEAKAISPSMEQKAIDEKARAMKHFSRVFDTRDGAPYSPTKRTGWWVVVGKSAAYRAAEKAKDQKALDAMEDDEAHHFVDFRDTKAEAEALSSHVAQKFGPGTYMFERSKVAAGAINRDEVFLAFDQLKRAIEGEAGKGSKAAARMQRLVNDLYLHTLSEASARKAELSRKGVPARDPVTGQVLDMMEAFASRGSATANFIASVDNGPLINKAIFDMQAELQEVPYDQREDAQRGLNEMMYRYGATTGQQPGRFVDKAVRTVSMWTLLTSPFYYLQNASQHSLITIPVMASHFGYAQSWGATVDAYKIFGEITKGTSMLDRVDYSKAPTEAHQKLLKTLSLRGRLDAGYSAENGQWEMNGDGILPKSWNMVDRFFRMMPQRVEVMNRVATGIATYDLAIKKGMSVEAATEMASKMIYDTHGDYSGFASPRPFTALGNFGKIALQFRKFQFIMGGLIGREFHHAFKGATPEERRQGKAALAFLSAHMAAIGGIVAQPAASTLGPVVAAVLNLLDDDDDKDWSNWQDMLKTWLGAGAEGDKKNVLADFLYKGAPYALLGTDLSDRLGMGNIAALAPFTGLPEVAENKDKMFEVLGKAMLGPSGGMLSKAIDGWGFAERGDWTRMAETIAPVGISNAMKASRLATQGLTARNGDVLVKANKLDGIPAALTAFGVRPKELVDQGERRSKAYQVNEFYKGKLGDLKADFIAAGDDPKAKSKVMDRFEVLQKARERDGLKRQKKTEITRAESAREKREAGVIGGVPGSANDRELRMSMLYAETMAEVKEAEGVPAAEPVEPD